MEVQIGVWDYITFGVLLLIATGAVALVVFIAGLPGRIALAREHPDAEAVRMMGWAGLLPVWPWIQAFIWAFKPSETIDIRRFPRETQAAIQEDLAKLSGGGKAKSRSGESASDAEH